ncbi:hypothetical protein CIP102550_01447 [Corynebacterium diphtheriae]|nr:hypothetical protein CIP102550_01447 [Corynebacterium diphtheriae]
MQGVGTHSNDPTLGVQFSSVSCNPITMHSVESILTRLGFVHRRIMVHHSSVIEIEWREYSLIVGLVNENACGTITEVDTHHQDSAQANPQLIVEGFLNGQLPLDEFSRVAESVNSWNNERVSPSARIRVNDSGSLSVAFRSSNSISLPQTDLQLAEFLQLASDANALAVRTFLDDFPALSVDHQQLLNAHLYEGVSSGFFDLGDDTSDVPSVVTMDRISPIMEEITSTADSLEVLYAPIWHSEAMIACDLESGPTIMMWAEWDSGLQRSDFMRIFLICNRWNDEAVATKAFIANKDETLRIRVETHIDAGGGLTDTQLTTFLSEGFNALMHSISQLKSPKYGLYDAPPHQE